MKKVISFIVLLILFSCSSEDSSPSFSTSSIVGKWDIKSRMNGTSNVVLTPCEEIYNKIEFLADKTVMSEEGYGTSGSCKHYTDNFTYNISKDILIIYSTDGIVNQETQFKILELTPAMLKLKKFHSKEIEKGVVKKDISIPENQQITESYDKI